jgi:hypothetical protein
VAPRIHKLETLLRESEFGQAEALGLEEASLTANRGYPLAQLARCDPDSTRLKSEIQTYRRLYMIRLMRAT